MNVNQNPPTGKPFPNEPIPAPSPRITICDRYATAWPPKEDEIAVEAVEGSFLDALQTECTTDAHFAAYEELDRAPEQKPRRLKKKALAQGVRARMTLRVFDLDGPDHKATVEWRAELESKLPALWQAHPGWGLYETKGGARLFWPCDQTLATSEDGERWSHEHAVIMEYLSASFGIQCDPACKDWTRLYRLPRVIRDGERQNGAVRVGELRPLVVPAHVLAAVPVRTAEGPAPAPGPAASLGAQIATAKAPEPKTVDSELERIANAQPSEQEPTLVSAATWIAQTEACAPSARAATIQAGMRMRNQEGREPWTLEAVTQKIDQQFDFVRRELEEEKAAAAPKGGALGPLAILTSLRDQGPPIPTGIAPLDRSMRGGLRLEKTLVLGGAPGAGKTSLARQMADHICRKGAIVGWFAADEEPTGVTIRRMQAIGVSREEAEAPTPETLARVAIALEPLPFAVFDPADPERAWTLETAAQELARLFPEGPRVLFLDSLQTVRTARTAGLEKKARIDDVLATMKAISRAASTRCAIVVTSELSRGAYRSEVNADAMNDLAAFKESGDIEYAGHVLCVMRNVPGEGETVSVTQPKNRLGMKADFLLVLDRDTTAREYRNLDQRSRVDHRRSRLANGAPVWIEEKGIAAARPSDRTGAGAGINSRTAPAVRGEAS